MNIYPTTQFRAIYGQPLGSLTVVTAFSVTNAAAGAGFEPWRIPVSHDGGSVPAAPQLELTLGEPGIAEQVELPLCLDPGQDIEFACLSEAAVARAVETLVERGGKRRELSVNTLLVLHDPETGFGLPLYGHQQFVGSFREIRDLIGVRPIRVLDDGALDAAVAAGQIYWGEQVPM